MIREWMEALEVLLDRIADGSLPQGATIDATKVARFRPDSVRSEVYRRAIARLERDGVISQDRDGSILICEIGGAEAAQALDLRAEVEMGVVRRLTSGAEIAGLGRADDVVPDRQAPPVGFLKQD